MNQDEKTVASIQGRQAETPEAEETSREEENSYWKLFRPYFSERTGGRPIPLSRVLSRDDDSYFVKVTALSKKQGEAIAECEIRAGNRGFYFFTNYEHYGHLDLCRYMRSLRIRGHYLQWLEAVEQDLDAEEEELRGLSGICFGLQETDACRDDWTIHLRIVDEGETMEWRL